MRIRGGISDSPMTTPKRNAQIDSPIYSCGTVERVLRSERTDAAHLLSDEEGEHAKLMPSMREGASAGRDRGAYQDNKSSKTCIYNVRCIHLELCGG